MLPNGTYRARCTAAELGESSKGTEQIEAIFELLTEGYEGQNITWFSYFTEATAKRTFEAMKYCGWNGDVDDLSSMYTKDVELVVEAEEYEGKARARIKWVNASGGRPLVSKKPMDPGKRRIFAAKMQGMISKLKTDAKPAEKPVDKSNIPF